MGTSNRVWTMRYEKGGVRTNMKETGDSDEGQSNKVHSRQVHVGPTKAKRRGQAVRATYGSSSCQERGLQ